jgi:hypothetical protein
MTDPPRIAERGAEQFAPRSRWGPSASESYRVTSAGAGLIAAHSAKQPTVVLDSEPPDAWLEIDGCATIANLRSADASSLRSRGAVEHQSQSRDHSGIAARPIACTIPELTAQCHGATPHTVPRLTSSRGDHEPTHVRVVLTSILAGTPVASRQPCGITVQLGTRALEGEVQ